MFIGHDIPKRNYTHCAAAGQALSVWGKGNGGKVTLLPWPLEFTAANPVSHFPDSGHWFNVQYFISLPATSGEESPIRGEGNGFKATPLRQCNTF
jgi:hypothetical protein